MSQKLWKRPLPLLAFVLLTAAAAWAVTATQADAGCGSCGGPKRYAYGYADGAGSSATAAAKADAISNAFGSPAGCIPCNINTVYVSVIPPQVVDHGEDQLQVPGWNLYSAATGPTIAQGFIPPDVRAARSRNRATEPPPYFTPTEAAHLARPRLRRVSGGQSGGSSVSRTVLAPD